MANVQWQPIQSWGDALIRLVCAVGFVVLMLAGLFLLPVAVVGLITGHFDVSFSALMFVLLPFAFISAAAELWPYTLGKRDRRSRMLGMLRRAAR
jgi:hypothetical protein